MAGVPALGLPDGLVHRLDIVYRPCSAGGEHGKEALHDLSHGDGVIGCAVMVEFRQLQRS